MEFVHGTNPKGGDTADTTVTIAPAAARMRRVRLSTRVNAAALTDYRLVWEQSSDGTFWGSSTADAEIIPGTGGAPDTVQGTVLVPDTISRMIFRARILPASTGSLNPTVEN